MTENNLNNSKALEGLVAGVLNERELVINIGETSGVRKGMIFKVLADEPVDILDPVTDESLGQLILEKIRVKVSKVDEKLSICRTYRKRVIGNLSLNIFEPRQEVLETLNADDPSYIKPLSEKESFIRRGDRVVQVLGG
jgi:hypothetical protein